MEKQKVYIVLDLDSPNKDSVWGVFNTLKLAENAEKILTKDNCLTKIIEEDIQIELL